jgi:3-deoxy-7-phosphoheptulonate synthase
MTRVLLLRPGVDPASVIAELARRGAGAESLTGGNGPALLVHGPVDLAGLPGLQGVLHTETPHPRVDEAPMVVEAGAARFGAEPVLIAGPCAVEDEESLLATVAAVAAAGASLLRGGAFKPRTSPYAFQGLGLPGLKLLRQAADRFGVGVVTEVLATEDVAVVGDHAELLQVGSRNMQNYALLKAVGRVRRPVLLKRGLAATVEEWLLAAEYLLDAGAAGVVLCERGLQAIRQPTRYTLDLGAVAWLLEHCRLPVVVDPSHAAGRRELVPRLARGAAAVGAHGLMVEVHVDPGRARCDAPQALTPGEFATLSAELRHIPGWGLPAPSSRGLPPARVHPVASG